MATPPIFITGAGGFIGLALWKRLEADDISKRTCWADILDQEDMGEVAEEVREAGAETVIHLAAHVEPSLVPGKDGWPMPGPCDIQRTYRTNVEGTANVLDLSLKAGVKHLIFASSQAVYGMPSPLIGLIREGDRQAPLDHYAASKTAAEYVLSLGYGRDLSVTILRIPGVYAEERKSGTVWEMCRSAVQEGVIRVHPYVRLPYDCIHREDVVDAIVKVIDRPREYSATYNVGTDEPCSLPILAADIMEMVPGCTLEVSGPEQPVVHLDTAAIRAATGWTPVPRKERLRTMIESVRDEKAT
jgi:nucleoside-diphosphate-sugar epimerase